MKAKILNTITEFFDQALGEKIGLVISTDDPEKTKRYFYKALKTLRNQDEKYSILKIITPPTNAHESIWIMKAEV